MRIRYIILGLLLFGIHAFAMGHDVEVNGLRCEYLDSPVGIESAAPRLSWGMTSSTRGQLQTAYQILVASTPEKLGESTADVWNSGKIRSSQSVGISYQGSSLLSGKRYYWKVRVWGKFGKPSAFSEPAFWEMGLLNSNDWKGKWISAVPSSDTTAPVLPAPFFRKEFTSAGKPVRANLYISGVGYAEAYLNGEKVSARVLDPAVTRYDRRRKYVVHDVTNLIRQGKNAMGIVLGNGWYNQHSRTAWDFDKAPWRDSPAVLAQLTMTWPDGKTETVSTDRSWQFAFGAITFNDIHNGEHYDARKELNGWNLPGYASKGWKPAFEQDPFDGVLSSHLMPPIRVIRSLDHVQTNKVGDTIVYDFGQNISGWVQITVTGRAGAQVTVRHGERINSRGTLDIRELSRFIFTGDVQTDRYTLKGEGPETWHPRFTYHGFQYVEVILPPEVEVVHISAEVVHTDFKTNGMFTCSDTLLNRIHENLRNSYLTNYHSYPTDCPHREKIGWTGDAHLMVESGLFNFDTYFAYRKWVDDFADEQQPSGDLPGIIPSSGWGYTFGKGETSHLGYGPQWEGAYLIILWQLYRHTSDTALVEKHFQHCKRYVDFLSANSNGDLISFGIDDHKQLKPLTEGDILSAGFYYYMADLLSRMAAIAGRPSDQKTYADLAKRIRAAFNSKYYNPETGIYGKGGQTQSSEALFLDLVETENRSRVLDNLLDAIKENNFRVETGVVGTKWLIHVLMLEGYDDMLYRMVSHTDFPGWGYWIKLGATTLFQNWDATQSRNHVMFGTIGDYLYQGLAGLRADIRAPGFKHYSIKPLLNNQVNFVKAEYLSMYGPIVIDWRKTGTRFIIHTKVPVNTTATIHLPASDPADVSESGRKLADVQGIISTRVTSSEVILEIASGTYDFEVTKFLQR